MHARYAHEHARDGVLVELLRQLPAGRDRAHAQLGRLVAAEDEHQRLLAREPPLARRAALLQLRRGAHEPRGIGLLALGQRRDVQLSAEDDARVSGRGLQVLLGRVGREDALEYVVFQNLVGVLRAAEHALALLALTQLLREPAQQLVKIARADGLEDIVVDMVFDGLLCVGELAEAGQHHDDRGRILRADVLGERKPVDERHTDVGDDHVGTHLRELFDGLASVGAGDGRIIAQRLPVCVLHHTLAHQNFVFHQHDLIHGIAPSQALAAYPVSIIPIFPPFIIMQTRQHFLPFFSLPDKKGMFARRFLPFSPPKNDLHGRHRRKKRQKAAGNSEKFVDSHNRQTHVQSDKMLKTSYSS